MRRFLFVLVVLLQLPCYSQSIEPAIDILKTYKNIRDFTLSNNGEEAYVSIQSPFGEVSVIAGITKTKSSWNEPSIESFSGQYKDLEPFLSPDNLRLYFVSNRPLDNSTAEPKDFDIWFVERKNLNSKWGTPINLGAPINTEHNEFYPSVAQNNNLYFTSDNPLAIGKDDIFFSQWKGNSYSTPVSLSKTINSEGYEFNAFVSKDESYIIFSGYNRKDGFGSADLYISLKDKDNNWKTAINLGDTINSKQLDYCPFVDEKNGTLYFTSKRSSFRKIQNLTTIQDLVKTINKTENGLSKVYKTSFDLVNFRKKN